MRRAVADDVIPLSEPITLSDGTTTDTLPITKGQVIYIPIASLQRLPELWGDDAAEFRPERFLEEDLFGRKDKTKYALWGDLLVFGGPSSSVILLSVPTSSYILSSNPLRWTKELCRLSIRAR